MKQILLAFFALALAAALPAFAANPIASAGEPHGTIYLNGSPKAHDLYPVRVRAIDGHLTVKENQPVIKLVPGTYTLQLRLQNITHMENLQGMTAGRSRNKMQDTLSLTVQPGNIYYIAGKVEQNGNWHPVVWKTVDHG